MLSLENIRYTRRGTVIIDYLDVTLFPGSIVQINGEGGRPLLKILSRIYKDKVYGKVRLNKVAADSDLATYLSQICYVPRDNYLDEAFTLRENIAFWAKLYNSPENVDFVIEALNISEYGEVPLEHTPLSIKARVYLCKILLSHSKIWLLENPFQWLDNEGRKILETLMESRRQQNGLVIFTSPYYRKMRYQDGETLLQI